MEINEDTFIVDWLDEYGHTISDVDSFKSSLYRRYLYFKECRRAKRDSKSSDKKLLDKFDAHIKKASKLLIEYRNRCHSFDEVGIIRMLDVEIERVDLLLLGIEGIRKEYNPERIYSELSPISKSDEYYHAIKKIIDSAGKELTDNELVDAMLLSDDIGNDFFIDAGLSHARAHGVSRKKGYKVESNNFMFIGGALMEYTKRYLPEDEPKITGNGAFYDLIEWCFHSLHESLGEEGLKRYISKCVGKECIIEIELSKE